MADSLPLVEYHGATLPARYSDPLSEYWAVRRAAGLFDFSFRSKFTARGSDRVRFLQGMVTNDLKILKPGDGTYAMMLDARGHILADLRVYCAEDSFILDTDTDLLEKALQNLNHYNIGGRTPLERLQLSTLAVQGPRAAAVLAETLGTRVGPLARLNHVSAEWAGSSVRVVSAENTGEEGYEIWTDRERLNALWDALLESGRKGGLVPCGVEALEILRIEAGIPKYGAELAEDVLPLEAGVVDAISFNKGCYLGQEIVERARSRGRVNWNLVGLYTESRDVPAKGEKLASAGNEVGEITSACASPALGRTIAMAYVRREFSEPKTKLNLASGAPAEVAPLPFYRRPG